MTALALVRVKNMQKVSDYDKVQFRLTIRFIRSSNNIRLHPGAFQEKAGVPTPVVYSALRRGK